VTSASNTAEGAKAEPAARVDQHHAAGGERLNEGRGPRGGEDGPVAEVLVRRAQQDGAGAAGEALQAGAAEVDQLWRERLDAGVSGGGIQGAPGAPKRPLA
jgi:hypothetical protein